jgi:predicted MPP superfamily phosphohydrolase
MRLAWLTDIHLNFVDRKQRRRFLGSISEQADVVALSGDIGESHNVSQYLREMDEVNQKPVYFVLGNHDFYKGSIAQTRIGSCRD